MTPWIGVLGTNGWPKDPHLEWWHPQSEFARFLATHDLHPARPDRPFVWSGDLDGIPLFSGKDWEAAAAALRYYLEDLPYDARNVIAHSHGGNCALMAAADGLTLRSLVMVGTPVRKDIETHIAPLAMRNVGRCLHITDQRWDTWGLLGGLFDFRVSWRRTFRVPGIVCEQLPGIGHAGILRDPALFQLGTTHHWIDTLTATLPDEALL